MSITGYICFISDKQYWFWFAAANKAFKSNQCYITFMMSSFQEEVLLRLTMTSEPPKISDDTLVTEALYNLLLSP